MEPLHIHNYQDRKDKLISRRRGIILGLLVALVLVVIGLWGLTLGKESIINIFRKKINKETDIETPLNGATTGKDDKGNDLSPEQRQELFNNSAESLALYIKDNPNDTDALGKLAGAYYNLGELDKAAETFKKVIALDSNDAIIQNNLANVLRDNKKYDEAEGYYKRSIELGSTLIAPYFNYAVMLGGVEGKKDEAIKILEEGLNKNPGVEVLKNLLTEYKK